MKRKPERLFACCTNNGKLVHLSGRGTGRTVCGVHGADLNPVRARVTCRRCAEKRPVTARRFEARPLVVGIYWEPMYRAFSRALDAGATKEPKVKVPYWPVLG